MSESEGAVATLTDESALEPGAIGPIEMRIVGKWDRVERALHGLAHDAVLYRWGQDSSGDQALYIEVKVEEGGADPDQLLKHRDLIRANIEELDVERPVYVIFIGDETDDEPADG